MAAKKTYRGIGLEVRKSTNRVAAIPFVSISSNVNTFKESKREVTQYRLQLDKEYDQNIWRPYDEICYVIDEILDNPNSIYNHLK